MDASQFDRWTLALSDSVSRRQTIVAMLLGGSIMVRGSEQAAAKKKKRKNKKINRNAFGCVNVGNVCKNSGQCCSGICEGKQGKKKCRAHDTGGCKPGHSESSCGGTDVTCTTATGFPFGACSTTSGKAGYCAGDIACAQCSRDVDCQAELGPLAACVICADCAEGTACATPDELG
jgi:hypothetical protein